jgi:hypothetical protein
VIDLPTEWATAPEWAYLAGLIDGEGCILSTHQKNSPLRYGLRVVVTQVDIRPIYWIQDRFGGFVKCNTVHTVANGRNYTVCRYTWGVYSRGKVEEILHGVLPYLVLKGFQARVALRQISEQTEELHQELASLKRMRVHASA